MRAPSAISVGVARPGAAALVAMRSCVAGDLELRLYWRLRCRGRRRCRSRRRLPLDSLLFICGLDTRLDMSIKRPLLPFRYVGSAVDTAPSDSFVQSPAVDDHSLQRRSSYPSESTSEKMCPSPWSGSCRLNWLSHSHLKNSPVRCCDTAYCDLAKVSHEYVKASVSIIVSSSHSHARLRSSISAVGY